MSPAALAATLLTAVAAALVVAPPGRSRDPARRHDEHAAPRPPGRASVDSPDGGGGRGAGGASGGLGVGAAAVGAGVAVTLLVGSVLGAVLGAAAVPVAWRWLSRLEPVADRRRREQLERDLPLLVDLLAACLRAGQAPEQALTAVGGSLEPGPLRDETAHVLARLRLGGDPVATWRAWGSHPQLGPVGRTVARALEGGASVADAMADLAHELRRTRRADVQARARSVGARAAAPLGLCLLPAFVLVGIVPVVAGSLGALLGP